MNITIAKPCAISEKGYQADNEDFIYPSPEAVSTSQKLFLVCDGKDGTDKGETAAAIACEHFRTFFTTMLDAAVPTTEFIRKAIKYTEAGFDTYIYEHPEAAGMKAALAMLHINPVGITATRTGDSCIYQFRNGEIIYSAVPKECNEAYIQGSHNYISIDVTEIRDIRPDDYFFICTGSVMENMSVEDLSDIFIAQSPPEVIKDGIVELCDAKKCDNYSFYIIPIQDVQEAVSYKKTILSFFYSIA
jgi:protein phosphatase